MQDLVEAKFNLTFLLDYLQLVAFVFFQKKAKKDLNVEIVLAREALAHAQEALRNLEACKELSLSTIATSSSLVVPQEVSLFVGLLS